MKQIKQQQSAKAKYTRRNTKRFAASGWSSAVDPGQYRGDVHDMLKQAGLL